MGYFDKFAETVTSKGKVVTEKAKETAELARLKLKVKEQEEAMKKAYIELGKRYYEEQGSDPAEDLVDACQTITDGLAEIESLEAQIAEHKGL